MNIDYLKLKFPDDLLVFVREVVDGRPLKSIPPGWNGILIYHPPTGQYYSTKSDDPLAYEEIVRLQKEPRWTDIALALRKMLEFNPVFQFFVLPVQARAHVEQWLRQSGKKRVSTRMGEAAQTEHVLFQVYSPFNKVTRYVVAPANTPSKTIISKANAGIKQWLESKSRVNWHERETMRVALRSRFASNAKVFEKEAEVTRTDYIVGVKHNQFRSIVENLNMKAIRQFIQTTAGA